jgi:hypothetical protein
MKVRAVNPIIVSLALVWLSLSVFGLAKLSAYESTPSRSGIAPAAWPELGLKRAAGKYTLLLSIHPQCPCTRATLQELAIALTHCPNLNAELLFIKPEGMSESWTRSDLWATAANFPRCTLIIDEAGKLSAALHAGTSGQGYLYNPAGQLVFSGGITQSRGHVGDNDGLARIMAIVSEQSELGNTTGIQSHEVFGCSLFGDRAMCSKKSGNLP